MLYYFEKCPHILSGKVDRIFSKDTKDEDVSYEYFKQLVGVSLEAFEATMEIMPSKFRSPPPKPPRRRYSDQLTISPSGTYPSSRKKHYDESKLCSKETQRKVGNSIGCGSLPTNWVPDFSTETKNENSMFSSSTSLSSTYVKNACVSFQMCSSSASNKDSNGLTDIMMEVDSKSKELFECVQKKELPYLEQVTTSGICAGKCNSRDFFEYLCNDIQHTSDVRDMLNDSSEHKSIPKYDHRRHHSDPLLSYPDGSNSKSSLQIYVPKSHSVLENISLDNQNRLCNSFNASFELKETQNLHEEIKNLKEVNNKLWQHLCSTQACLEKVTKNAEENVNSLSVSGEPEDDETKTEQNSLFRKK
ncbi:hypothetical protein AVEN_180836-1 [Araneus ventricosus]|uniref:Uncharacterized protein n=1 Tax=Araneus ventricosus TaxID=182803 RepID=A0A4Y2TXI8_ARAVE|nr:hypothetical protein AVEN_180836-1 [Araneus ventricosus]